MNIRKYTSNENNGFGSYKIIIVKYLYSILIGLIDRIYFKNKY